MQSQKWPRVDFRPEHSNLNDLFNLYDLFNRKCSSLWICQHKSGCRRLASHTPQEPLDCKSHVIRETICSTRESTDR